MTVYPATVDPLILLVHMISNIRLHNVLATLALRLHVVLHDATPAWLKPEDIRPYFVILASHPERPRELQGLYAYFQDTWVGSTRLGVELPPRFHHEEWSQHSATENQPPPNRTTNALEGYHRDLLAFFRSAHPELYLFLSKIESYAEDTLPKVGKLRMGEEPQRLARYRAIDVRLATLVRRFYDGSVDFMHFLRGVCHNFASFDV